MTDLLDTVKRRWASHHRPVHKKQRLLTLKRYVLMRGCKESDVSPYELQLCNIVAWTGVLVISAVILRSLYLLYLKPEGT